MFYGLSNFFKKILPKRLFYRALLIVAIPVIVLQLVITIVFFDSLWIKTNKGMTRALINEVKTFIEVYKDEIYDDIINEITVGHKFMGSSNHLIDYYGYQSTIFCIFRTVIYLITKMHLTSHCNVYFFATEILRI